MAPWATIARARRVGNPRDLTGAVTATAFDADF